MKLHRIAFILLIIGGINWLLTGIFPAWNLADYITVLLARIVYLLVGAAAVYEIFGHKDRCKDCCAPKMDSHA
jgi:uncharacterized protein